jgi:hypothetical protein
MIKQENIKYAEEWHGCDCFLNDVPARIYGKEDGEYRAFPIIQQISSPHLQCEWAWVTVDRIMRGDKHFKT